MAERMYTLRDLLLHELSDLYSAENQIIEALPKLAEAAAGFNLRRAFEDHFNVTREQRARLDRVFDMLGDAPSGETCLAMKGIIAEGEKLVKLDGLSEPSVLDAALIAAAQRVEHYEIAAYGCARTFARLLGEDAVADILQTTLDEEGSTDKLLTELAMTEINVEAKHHLGFAGNATL